MQEQSLVQVLYKINLAQQNSTKYVYWTTRIIGTEQSKSIKQIQTNLLNNVIN
jgi:hypothetical protein